MGAILSDRVRRDNVIATVHALCPTHIIYNCASSSLHRFNYSSFLSVYLTGRTHRTYYIWNTVKPRLYGSPDNADQICRQFYFNKCGLLSQCNSIFFYFIWIYYMWLLYYWIIIALILIAIQCVWLYFKSSFFI